MAVGRIGDVINGEHFARSTDLPWGIVYTNPNSPSYIRFGPEADPQHPAVAYEMFGDLLIFVILLFVYFRVPRAGVTFFAWVFLYGLLRFAVSFLRLDDEVILGLTMAQVIAVAWRSGWAGSSTCCGLRRPRSAAPTAAARTSTVSRHRLLNHSKSPAG
jgi:phosphatidylglycerol:prolipoprotein diacylglycerol transferase